LAIAVACVYIHQHFVLIIPQNSSGIICVTNANGGDTCIFLFYAFVILTNTFDFFNWF
jgi:hypothetical protein